MSTEKPQAGHRTGATAGALLLCRAEPESVAQAAHPLRERMVLTRAGDDWSVLVPEGRPWLHGDEPVDRVLTGWAAALAVGAPWPVLALWWDADRAGYTLASGFRRPVGYVWLADGTPAGEDEAMRTFAARLDLDPVLDLQSLDDLTKPDPESDARTRLRGLLAVLTRAGVALPAGLAPGAPADRLREIARIRPDARQIERSGWREAVRAELEAADNSRLGPWLPWSGTYATSILSMAQLTAGVPLTAWGLRRRSPGWTVAGALLMAQGALGIAYELACPRD
ncbi:hypothetical protein [Streptomyces sp. MBT53]|uniref:hypothetical protein n=1 Tax=Streptomyces sp. MBT53 TaxID=1488384 RepID=UPI0019117D27|nr:hypothetical protein [Streptomyces sp. MBT53]MBK6014354.1 hypothetical protein [Streptomyces sp. MBT53]